MRLAFFIAWRYLLSKRLPGAVNVITWVAMLGILVVAGALVIVLSVFNGFNNLIVDLYDAFDADLRVVAAQGRYLPLSDSLLNQIKADPSVQAATYTLECKAVAKQSGQQQLVLLKGVGPGFTDVSDVESLITAGSYSLRGFSDTLHGVVLGSGVVANLGANLNNLQQPLRLFTLSQQRNLASAGEEALRSERAVVVGQFSLHKEYDEQFALADIRAVQRLLDDFEHATAYEIALKPNQPAQAAAKRIQKALGSAFNVQTGAEQHASLFRIMQNEKAVGFLVLALMMLLASVNIVGSLTMIVIDKRRDIGMLASLGATQGAIRRIFLLNGLLVGGLSGLIGIALGALFVALQAEFHFLKLHGGENFIIDYFPVDLQAADIALVSATVLALALLASVYPAWRAATARPAENLKA